MVRLITLSLSVALLLSYSIKAYAQETTQKTDNLNCLDDICFEQFIDSSYGPLEKRGIAKMTYFFFDLYVATLYTLPNADIDDKDKPKVLILHYLRDFKAQDFIKSGEKVLRKDLKVDLSIFSKELSQIRQIYSPVKQGDRYTIAYTPQQGLSLSLNGKFEGQINNDRFANHYLDIWLSSNGIDRSLAEKLAN